MTEQQIQTNDGNARQRISDVILPDTKKSYDYWPPMSVTSFEEYEQWSTRTEAQKNIWAMVDVYGDLIYNVMADDDIEDKASALSNLANEFATRVDGELSKESDDQRPVFIYKDTDGNYYFIGVYSNQFEDREGDIISSSAHQEFAKALNDGEADYPELWVWHIPNAIGKSTLVTYDKDTGMAVVGGYFYNEYNWLAEQLSKASELGMSHGMPIKDIERSQADKSTIIRYRSKEVSVLPVWAAANVLTEFGINKDKGFDMDAIKSKLLQIPGMTEESVAMFMQSMQSKKDAADATGLQRKEQEHYEEQSDMSDATPEQATLEEEQQLLEEEVDEAQVDSTDKTASDTDYNNDTVKAIADALVRVDKSLSNIIDRLEALESNKTVSNEHSHTERRKSVGELLAELPFGEQSIVKSDDSNDISPEDIQKAGPQVAPEDDNTEPLYL